MSKQFQFTDLTARMFLASFENNSPSEQDIHDVLNAYRALEFVCENDKELTMSVHYVYITPSARKIIIDSEKEYLFESIEFTSESN